MEQLAVKPMKDPQVSELITKELAKLIIKDFGKILGEGVM
jgi:hypothetical protein